MSAESKDKAEKAGFLGRLFKLRHADESFWEEKPEPQLKALPEPLAEAAPEPAAAGKRRPPFRKRPPPSAAATPLRLPEPSRPSGPEPVALAPESAVLAPEPVVLAPEPRRRRRSPWPWSRSCRKNSLTRKPNWWSRLRHGLARSSSSIGQGVADIFTKRKLSSDMLEDLEDVLVRADLGISAASRIAALVGKGRYDKQIAPEEVRAILADEVERVLAPGREAAGNRRSEKTLCYPGGRGQRLRQDHDHWQADGEIPRRGQEPCCSRLATPSAPPPSSSCASGAGG